MIACGFNLRAATVLLSTIYNYTLSFTMEEQAVFPTPGNRAPHYSLEERSARLDPTIFPLQRQATPILFDRYDRRYREGLGLILNGANPDAGEGIVGRRLRRSVLINAVLVIDNQRAVRRDQAAIARSVTSPTLLCPEHKAPARQRSFRAQQPARWTCRSTASRCAAQSPPGIGRRPLRMRYSPVSWPMGRPRRPRTHRYQASARANSSS